MKIANSLDFKRFLIMPPAYYKYGDKEAIEFYSKIIEAVPKSEIIYYIYLSDIFIGNDSFGHHVACQMNKPSFVILLDTPKAYSDYSKNQYRLTPSNIDINDISHDSALDPNSITIDMILI